MFIELLVLLAYISQLLVGLQGRICQSGSSQSSTQGSGQIVGFSKARVQTVGTLLVLQGLDLAACSFQGLSAKIIKGFTRGMRDQRGG